MSAAALPATHYVVAFGNEIVSAGEAEVGECRAKPDHEGSDVIAAAPRCVQRVLQEHVRSRQLIDDLGVPRIAPEFREPAADDGLVPFKLGRAATAGVSARAVIVAASAAAARSTVHEHRSARDGSGHW
jgi:hypothetical protein